MMQMFNLRLKLPVFLAFFLFLPVIATARAQDSLPETQKPPVFVELFSSQACVFCPQADRLFSDLIRQEHVMGIACHIDYFDVREGALSHPFCTERQSWYMKALGAGPNYTPQMVVNGHHDVVGYKLDDVSETLKLAENERIIVFNIFKKNDNNVFEFTLPALELSAAGSELKLWLAVYENYEGLTIKQGRNKGRVADYPHIVRNLQDIGGWDGSQVIRIISPDFVKNDAGFYVLAQDRATGTIVAVGQYSKPI